jgi:hypothetical protein
VFTLPALFSGVVEVLVPLRLDDLGVAGATIGLVFLLERGGRGGGEPDRRTASRTGAGRLAPIRTGLTGAVIMAIVLPIRARRCLSACA